MISSRIQLIFFLSTITKQSLALTTEEKYLLVAKHNSLRSQVSPTAADMLEMTWDTRLENFAKNYTSKCLWSHDAENKDKGENLYATTGNSLDVKKAVQEWYDEHTDYDFNTNHCNEDKMCGHYTQVVWATSEKVGCHEQFCKILQGTKSENWYLLMCYYYPAGNFEGEKPYKDGLPCLHCPKTYECTSALCTLPKPILTSQVPSTSELSETISSKISWTYVPTTPPSTETASSQVSWTDVSTESHSTESTYNEYWTINDTISKLKETTYDEDWPMNDTVSKLEVTVPTEASWPDVSIKFQSTEETIHYERWPVNSTELELSETSTQVSQDDVPTNSHSTEETIHHEHWPVNSAELELSETTSTQVSQDDVPTNSQSIEITDHQKYWPTSSDSVMIETTSSQVAWSAVPTISPSTDTTEQEDDMYSPSIRKHESISSAVPSRYSHLSSSLAFLLILHFI